MKAFVTAIFVVLLFALPVSAARNACNAAMATATCNSVCDNATQILWSLSMSPSADAKLQAAFARAAGWTATVTCTQAMVDLSQCLVGEIGTQVTNPVTERNAAKAEFRRVLRDNYIHSQAAEELRELSEAELAAAIAALVAPDTGN